MNLVAAYGYISKPYHTSKNGNTGKIVGTFGWWWVFNYLMFAFCAYLVRSSSVWGIILAILVTLMAIVWYL